MSEIGDASVAIIVQTSDNKDCFQLFCFPFYSSSLSNHLYKHEAAKSVAMKASLTLSEKNI